MYQLAFTTVTSGGTLLFRTRTGRLVVAALALVTATASLPSSAAADSRGHDRHRPSSGGLSAVVR
ncbi:hypothetical protein ACFU5O_13810 [Streptomyces sp. NPDC057445]|uniref:hypothetical protein n=1 Tax=Streptomyces sp. NPDC057445 TaxID=3346136 RepID=UPI0036ABFA98